MLLSFCNCKKNTITKTDESRSITTIDSACPEDGKCSVEIFRNKSLEIKTDETGATYYQILDATETSVILYQYNRNTKEGLRDNKHREEIVFEIANSDSAISLSDLTLQKTKMLFGRHCFCRGQTGYFRVNEGNLKLEQKENAIRFSLDFKITQIPQTIHSITATIK
jgi:hypothetical protein